MSILKVIDAITPEIYWISAIYVFFFSSWLLTRGQNRINWMEAHPFRRIMFYPSLLFTCVSFGAIDSNFSTQFTTKSNLTLVAIVNILTSGIYSVYATELFRVANFFGSNWTDKKHFRIMFVTWIGLFIIAMIGVMIARRSSYVSVVLR